ncbi:MAG: winged helix-turn-helix domain-containing protein [Gemmatimonadota bacterium]|nr:winged helix-turn-helix domain-containing protein [Gemmatimonadota bacterium]
MLDDSRDRIAETLRGRILRGVQVGALRPGDRLPSARKLAREFGVDQRPILDAYRRLASENLVELRPRGGIYVTATPSAGGMPVPGSWLAGVLTEALAREIPSPELHELLRRCTETLRLRAVVIASTMDQVYGLRRELRDDFGLEADGLSAEEVRAAPTPPLPLRRADLVVTTPTHEEWVRRLADDLRKPVTVVKVREDLRAGEWALLLRRPVYAVVATPEFGDILRGFFADVPGAKQNLRIVVLGRDDLSTIPDDAPAYVTQRARDVLGDLRVPGRILAPARTIATGSAHEIFAFVVRANVAALGRLGR